MMPPFPSRLAELVRSFSDDVEDLFIRRPLYLLGRQRLEIRHLFRGIESTPAAVIYTGVLWVIPMAMINAYTAPYMVECGMSRAELGLFTAWGQGLSLVGFLLGGYLSDTWGRKRTLVFFDITSWGMYTLCLAVGMNKWWCTGAILAMATNAGATVPYHLLLVEGVKPFKRSKIFTLLQLVNLMPSLVFLPLVGGMLVTKYGLKPAGHLMYWAFFLAFAVGTYLRMRFLPDVPPPEKAPSRWWDALKEVVTSGRDALAAFLKKPAAKPFFFAKFLQEWKMLAWNTYSALFLIEAVRIPKGDLAVLAQAGAYVTFVVLVMVIPYIPVKRFMRFLGYEQALSFMALALLLLARDAGAWKMPLCFMATGLGAMAGAFLWSANSPYWLSIMGEKERPRVMSAAAAAFKIGIFLVGPLAAVLYVKVSPESLVVALMVLHVAELLLLRRVVKEAPHAATAGA